MNLLWRVLKLFFGLIYRLIVLALFERWIPFESAKEPAKPAARQKRPKVPPPPPQPQRKVKPPAPRSFREADFFLTRSIEPAPELVPTMEAEHMRIVRKQAPRPAKRAPSLKAMLRDRNAVRDAVILGTVFSPPRNRR